jgi:hypothetical protein
VPVAGSAVQEAALATVRAEVDRTASAAGIFRAAALVIATPSEAVRAAHADTTVRALVPVATAVPPARDHKAGALAAGVVVGVAGGADKP